MVMKPLREEIAGKTQMALVVLLFTSAALMLIACVNLANLLISRGTARGGKSRCARHSSTTSWRASWQSRA